jgi:L-asparaginase/Glu-tRNA(Gln) amidotransferase subunit D
MSDKPIVFTEHARERMKAREAAEDEVREAIRIGEREPAQRGLVLYKLNLDFHREWAGRYYAVKQVAPVVASEGERLVVDEDHLR